jgi:hypothetical protein
MKRIRIEKPKPRRRELEVLPLDPRDPDIVRAKALMRSHEGIGNIRSRREPIRS